MALFPVALTRERGEPRRATAAALGPHSSSPGFGGLLTTMANSGIRLLKARLAYKTSR